jgi:4-hydroxy-tetrahydrodipicolinate synthase
MRKEKKMALTPEEMREKINAVVVVMATPFNEDGSIDFQGLKANTQFLVDRCRDKRFVLVPTGSTGEYYAMSPDEQIKVIETVIETVDGQLPVVAGTAAAGTQQTIALSQAAEKAGADGVQVVLPFYHVPSEEGLYRHFVEVADALDIGLMIYNNPAVSKLWMPPHIMARCSEHPHIVADKENTPDVTQYKAMRDAVDPKQMSVLCGLGDLQFAYEAALGCPGFVSWTANFAPDYSLALLDAAGAADFWRVRDIIEKTGQLYDFVGTCARHRGRDPWMLSGYASGHIYVGIMKAAMELMGLAGGPVRGPGDDLTQEEKEDLRQIMSEIGLLENRTAMRA